MIAMHIDLSIVASVGLIFLVAVLSYYMNALADRLASMESRQAQNALNIESIRKEVEELHRARIALDNRIAKHDEREEELYRQLPSMMASALEPLVRRLERIEDRLMGSVSGK